MNDLHAALIECLRTYGNECRWTVKENPYGIEVKVIYPEPRPGFRALVSSHAAE